ncbi:type I-U CRISPR-associated protein Cas7 [Candidatus Bathyarchaeota archaeon]|nr:type I-U CRISPR-associated protein Cas7 [Candidatus Bathyarchaeota archaeon]NIU81281.1 type I-U CRISPR-associated protein Cas7 [Candidatus Bathyarchaeota archaeon]NIV67916.1 type I-U CRISPR-associated protein Cas7 [Candidatus Bathyarchaeota archaeon]NIW34499.1 type I-U CRISPR-associated protein Cas7 [Candidatus Bathyarchaeota archaeon]
MTDSIKKIYTNLSRRSRLLMEAELEPVQGDRFQPTGFPDLGAAEYTAPDGTQMILVESVQSMANRLEAVCWDEEEEKLVSLLQGLPYVHVDLDEEGSFTNSILEAHRINSEYITGKKNRGDFDEKVEEEIGYDEKKPVPFQAFYRVLLKYDPNCLIHGVFLEEIGGRLKVPRMLSAFIEASDVRPVQSGGVKFSRVEPTLKEGEGNVPYPRTEYTAEKITAYFNIDLAGIRGFGLDPEADKLLLALSLYKIRRFLREGLRLRTACDLRLVDNVKVTNIEGLEVPSVETLEEELPALIQECSSKGLFADPPVTKTKYKE